MKSMILKGMKKYKIKSLMVTTLSLFRWKLITKEKMKNYCKGKEDEKESVNDDLEVFFENIRLGKNVENEELVGTYFLPKLTKEELKLVENKNSFYLATFFQMKPDVEKAEMEASESDSKYVHAISHRGTFTLCPNDFEFQENLSSRAYSNGFTITVRSGHYSSDSD